MRTDFDLWLRKTFRKGPFTALIVLVRIAEPKVEPLRSTFVHVIGDDMDWGDVSLMFRSAGIGWDGAAFFPERENGQPVPDPMARVRLRLLESRIEDDRLVLNEGGFFDVWGRQMRIDETEAS
ncbi:hypothetical protein [Terrihabitans sp. B22-R8]|uniref:hypothetical protein n=1 Tax=Terrihabitans sp. B22-R8 TaxID=3425128 RepID=UPI00403C796D